MSTVNYLTARSSNLATFNTVQLNVSTLTGSTIQTTATANTSSIVVSTLTTRSATYSTLSGSSITSNTLTLSTLTVSSINSGAPGVAAYSTFNASSINVASTITTSTLSTSGNITQSSGTFFKNSATATSYMTMAGGDASNSPFMEFYYGGLRRCYIGNATASSFELYCQNNATFNLYTGDSLRILVNNAGNVGIGTNSASEKLSVIGNVYSYNGTFLVNNTATYQTVGVQMSNTNASTTIQLSISGTTGWASAGTFGIYNGCASNGGFALNILPNGNVGIGTTNPSQKLEVNGTVRATGYNLSGYNFLIPKVVYVGSQVLTGVFSGTTNSSGTASFPVFIGAYGESIIEGAFRGGSNPDTTQYFKAYYITAQITNGNDCQIGVAINNTVLANGITYSSPSFMVIIQSGYFLKWTQFPTQGAYGYQGTGLNLQVYQSNTSVTNFQVNYITVHCVYLHTSYTTYPTVSGLTYNSSYQQFN